MKSELELPIAGIAGAAGKILAISYPILAISTGFRAGYQLFLKEEVGSYIGPALTAVACLLYFVAAYCFTRRQKWAWQLAVGALTLEALLTIIVGAISLINPDFIGSSVWRNFGADYAYFPLIQPILGLIWLLHPTIRHAYGV